jgi:hypothetical protein
MFLFFDTWTKLGLDTRQENQLKLWNRRGHDPFFP